MLDKRLFIRTLRTKFGHCPSFLNLQRKNWYFSSWFGHFPNSSNAIKITFKRKQTFSKLILQLYEFLSVILQENVLILLFQMEEICVNNGLHQKEKKRKKKSLSFQPIRRLPPLGLI
jgi:hypothetical protein